jgi:hypothetical protein
MFPPGVSFCFLVDYITKPLIIQYHFANLKKKELPCIKAAPWGIILAVYT